MDRVGVFSFGRTGSQRCPNKLLRPFGGRTLTDIVLSKLLQFPHRSFFAAYEEEFRRKCERAGVPFVQRDQRSVLIDEPIAEILSFLQSVDYDYLLLVSPCLPFLRVETITAFLENCIAGGYRPAFSVMRRKNYFMTLDRRPLNFDPAAKTINTKAVDAVYEFAHALYFFKRRFFLDQGRYWDWGVVRLVELGDRRELIDIDTEEDFQWAERLWKASETG